MVPYSGKHPKLLDIVSGLLILELHGPRYVSTLGMILKGDLPETSHLVLIHKSFEQKNEMPPPNLSRGWVPF